MNNAIEVKPHDQRNYVIVSRTIDIDESNIDESYLTNKIYKDEVIGTNVMGHVIENKIYGGQTFCEVYETINGERIYYEKNM